QPKARYYHHWTLVDDGIYYLDPDAKSIEFFSFATRPSGGQQAKFDVMILTSLPHFYYKKTLSWRALF
ncbi:MAG: hypothetical protein O6850_00375, partial [Acidobacteria bacterium]|nr:hypothetical protein [Acidobacteriota bacterium]